MEVKYYGVPEGLEPYHHDVLDHFEFYIQKILDEKDRVKKHKDFHFVLNETDVYAYPELYENGLLVTLQSTKTDQYDTFACIRVIITPHEVNYVVSRVEGINPTTGRHDVMNVNEEVNNSLVESLGTKLVVPTSRFKFIEKKRVEDYNAKVNALFDLYFEKLKDEKLEVIKQIESEEDKKRRKEKVVEESRKQIESRKTAFEESVKKYKELVSEEIYRPKSRLPFSALLQQVDDHFEFYPFFLENNRLREIDLSEIDFTNVKVCGLDLSDTNASIDPQKVYMKDLSNGHYEGVLFDFKSFDGVDITNSTFGPGVNHSFVPILDGAIDHNNEKGLK